MEPVLIRGARVWAATLLLALGWIAPAAATTVREARASVAIVGARILESPEASPIEDGLVLIEAGVIRYAGPRHGAMAPEGYQTLDWTGLTVLAGFWNTHVHLTTPAYLMASELDDAALEAELSRTFTRWGFTTVFDLASTTAISRSIAGRVERGAVRGPRVLSVAEPFYPPDGTPIYAQPFYEQLGLPSAEVMDVTTAAARARQQIRAGAHGLKLFTGSIVGEAETVHMPAAFVDMLSQEASAHEVPVFAHPTDRAGLELAVHNGVDILAHAAPLMGGWSPLYAKMIADHGVALTPTLSLFRLSPHPSTPVSVAVQQTRALHEAGGTILFGTDAGFVDEFSPEPEMVLLEEAVGWRGVVEALTTAPARVLGDEAVEGRVSTGYVADLVAVGCDPARSIHCLADVRKVMRGGVVIHSVTLPGRKSAQGRIEPTAPRVP